MSLSARPLVRSRTLKSVSSSLKKSSAPTQSRKRNTRKKSAFLTRYAEPEITESVQGVEMFLPVRLPGFNEAIAASKTGRGRFNRYARDKEEIQTVLCLMLKTLGLRRFDKCRIGFTWVEPDRKRDIDNISAGKKYILDSLVSLGVLKDDSWKYVKGFLPEFFEADKNNWGVRVRIEEV